jgi:hypothetical protein
LGIITHINKICTHYNIQHGKITIGCNGQGAIQVVTTYDKWSSLHKHFDLISSIQTSIVHSLTKWKFCHIKGHQDDILNYNKLNHLEQLNIATDFTAKEKLSAMIALPHWDRWQPQHLPLKKVEIYWTNWQQQCTKICSTLMKTLTNKIQSTSIQKY